MWRIPRPQITALRTLNACILGVRDTAKRNRLEGIRQAVEDAELDFTNKGNLVDLHLVAETTLVAGISGNVTSGEMTKLYDQHMARQKSRGRSIYDKIMISASHGQCPFCGHLPVSTLDHSLAKNTHPVLALTPINLIPCCKDCNHNKGTSSPSSRETQFIHAYFDDLSNSRWLYAEIIEAAPPSAVFFVRPPDDWDTVVTARVENHFEKLQLAKMYSSQAGRQFQDIRALLLNISNLGGAQAVSEELLQQADSRRAVDLNSWEASLLEAASENDWFCNGGFNATDQV